jgi:hypothetical protein
VKRFTKFQFSSTRGRAVCSILALLAAGLLGPRQLAAAHGILAAYIQHGVHLRIDGQHMDLTLDLTFFEEPSARERAVMDADANGRITRSEVDAYLKRLAPELFKQVKLRVAGREVPLTPLYDPDIDLFTGQTTATAHHRLRLCLFAATPAGLRVNDEILVEDQLWPGVKSLGTPQAEGGDGCRLLPEISIDSNSAALPRRVSCRFGFRCVQPPTFKTTAASGTPIPTPPQPKLTTP